LQLIQVTFKLWKIYNELVLSQPNFDVFYVTSVKRENRKIIGISAIQHRCIPPVRLYIELDRIYHMQFTEMQFVFLVPYVTRDAPLEVSSFRLQVKKEGEEFLIVIPDTVEKRQGLASLPEYVRMPSDFI